MRITRGIALLVAGTVAGVLVSGCGSSAPSSRWAGGSQSPDASLPAASPSTSAVPSASPGATAGALPRAGNPNGHAAVPADGQAVDTSHPNRIIGNGTPASCTSEELVSAIAVGGVITFNCGPAPVTITMKQTAKVRNASSRVALDGGGKVILSGGGQRRILYQNTCDAAQGWSTSHCQDQETPALTEAWSR